MRPFIFNIGELEIPSFFFMIMVGTLSLAFYCYWVAQRVGLKREVFLDLGMIGMLAGILGTRIFHILVEAPDYYWEHPMRVFEFWRGGFVSWGAYIAVPLAAYIYLKIRKLPIIPYLEILAIGTPLLQLSIRIACLLAGCCYGKPTDLPWAITFTDPASTAFYYYPNIPLHPTQIYSVIHAIILFAGVNIYYFKGKHHFAGQMIPVMLLGYVLPRSVIEYWRADVDRGMWFGGVVSTGQVMALVSMAFLVWLYIYLKKRAAQSEAATQKV